ncbi:hypothetical protein F1559_001294 [Cyanidiococcus yangmingshanensis]|uniref:Uncharacterized protein n=1 Tax=Cyanidiococcus yangmingshanensis TaxID=2690220 RepID=A0A7J7II90_9RHOD|nr:hypothetical protein F1559_001294 [Cyanidiococcus yangmingshanensis]
MDPSWQCCQQWTAQPERQPADWGVATGLRLEFLRCSGRTSLPETVSCPRCARLVTERGGICPGCKENVYQCRACRFIDYGRLNALLCRECGHSRYLRYEVELETSAVDPLHQVQSRSAQRRGQALLPSSSYAPTVTTPPGLASPPTRDAPSARPQSSETRDAQS